MANRTGFYQTNTDLIIDKDPLAQLIYTFDWTDWLEAGDALATCEYTAAARRNDPEPIVIESQGQQGTKTYVELAGGQVNKTYIITAEVTTVNGLRDRRYFRVNVVDRAA